MVSEKKFNEIIGNNVRKYRLIYNANEGSLSQRELAEKVGVSVSMIGALESRKINQGISIYNLYKISEVLSVPIEEFFK